MAVSEADLRQLNENIFEHLQNPSMTKSAVDEINDWTRSKVREEGVVRQIIEPVPIGFDKLDRQADTEDPVKVIDKERNIPAAISVGYGTNPDGWYIRGSRYRAGFSRILTPRFIKDVIQLGTYVMDLRQMVSDNSVKDVAAEEDTKAVRAWNIMMIGPGVPVPWNGNEVLWRQLDVPVSREGTAEALKTLYFGPARIGPETILINVIMVHEFIKFRRDEVGGDFAEEVFRDGFSSSKYMGKKLLATIKREIIPDNTMFMFGPTNFMGKHYELEPLTLYIRKEAFMLEFFGYQTTSLTFVAAVARVDFQ